MIFLSRKTFTISLLFTILLFINRPTSLIGATASENISAQVNAYPTDYIASLRSVPDTTTVNQNETAEYIISYGSKITQPSDIIVEAEWSLGTPQNQTVPTISLLRYITNSAKNAYGNTPAVVDLVNRKVSWTISNFPGNTTKEVSFFLATNKYQTTIPIDFTVSARVYGIGTQTSDSYLKKVYVLAPEPTGIPPTGTPAPTPTPIPLAPFYINSVSMQAIATNEANIRVNTSEPATVSLIYGTSPNNMSNTLRTASPQKFTQLTLSSLNKDTPYYFRVKARNLRGQMAGSDIYTFRTAKEKSISTIKQNSIIITSNNIVLHAPTITEESAEVVLPEDAVYEINFAIAHPEVIQSLQGIIQGENNTDVQNNLLFSIKNGLYVGRFHAQETGVYTMLLRINDTRGNITEEPVTRLFIKRPLLILDSDSHKPIEKASLTLSRFNETTRIYNLIPSNSVGIPNPAFSDTEGHVNIVLPSGKYRAEVQAIGYQSRQVDFSISTKPDENYPTIELEKQPFSILTMMQDFLDMTQDFTTQTRVFIAGLAASHRFFHLQADIVLLSFILLTFIAFSARIHIRLQHLPRHLLHQAQWHNLSEDKASLRGYVCNEAKQPLSRANILLFSGEKQFITQIQTNQQGIFQLPINAKEKYQALVTAPGYKPMEINVEEVQKPFNITLVRHESAHVESVLIHTAGNVMGALFEVFLILTLLLELLFLSTLGPETVPYIFLSMVNVSMWIFLQVSSKQLQITK